MNAIHIGNNVAFKTHMTEGSGKVTNIFHGKRGAWIEVQPKHGHAVKVRAGHITSNRKAKG